MNTRPWSLCRAACGLVALLLCVAAPSPIVGQGAAQSAARHDDIEGFREFSRRVEKYVALQRKVVARLPVLKPTDLPEMITAYQQALARKIREARPHAKRGDLFTSDAREAFCRASRVALAGPNAAGSRAYMAPGAPNPLMRLEVNGIYPDSEPNTSFPPELLAAFPPLPVEVAYRIVGRALIVVDVESRLIVDVARLVLPPA